MPRSVATLLQNVQLFPAMPFCSSGQQNRQPMFGCVLQGSTSGAKRAFLRGKGVTDDEIDEAFKRAASATPPPAQKAEAPAEPEAARATSAAVAQASAPSSALQIVPSQRTTWLQSTASVALLACAAYGVGSLLSPYAKRCWRYWRGEARDESLELYNQLSQLLAKYTQRQDEKLQAVSDATASAVQELKVRSHAGVQASRCACCAVHTLHCLGTLTSMRR
jgi:Pex14 N-terminal domain